MKKILGIILVLIPIFSVGSANIVKAAENDSQFTKQVIDGAYYYQRDKDTGKTMTGHANKFYLNGKLAYCIEPLVQITDHTYNSTTDWSVVGLTDEQEDYIEKVGYFGYEYPGHQTDRYYMAAQQLIWEKARNVETKYTTERGGGSEIDLSKEKNEILSLVNNYNSLPSFVNDKIEANMGDEISLNDTNNVLSQFSVEYNGKNKVSVDNNTLKIKFSDNFIGEETIKFVKKNYDSQVNLIYYKASSQTLASLRISNPLNFELKIKANGGTVEINKKGEKIVYSDGTYRYETISLPEVEFAIYANGDIVDSTGKIVYKKYDLVGTVTSDSLGFAKLEDMYYGKYFLIEGKSSQGNMLDNEKYYFEISKNDLVEGSIIKKLDIQNYLPKGTLEFTKLDITNGKVIPNTEIMVFTEDDRLIYQGMTDENGKIVITDLLAGQKYYIIERNPATGYQLSNEKVYFEIKANGEVVKAEMTNEQIEKVQVPDTQKDQSSFGNIASIVVIVAAIGVLIYGEVKNKKNKSKKDKKEEK